LVRSPVGPKEIVPTVTPGAATFLTAWLTDCAVALLPASPMALSSVTAHWYRSTLSAFGAWWNVLCQVEVRDFIAGDASGKKAVANRTPFRAEPAALPAVS